MILFNSGCAILGLAGVHRDNATCIPSLQNFIHAKRAFSVERSKFWVRMIACSMLWAKARMLSAWLTVLQKHERQHQLGIRNTTYNKIPLSGFQRRARHALAHDKLLQMGSYGIHSALSSTRYIWHIDVDLFIPVSESRGCKRQLACLSCARSCRVLAFKVLQKVAHNKKTRSNKLKM